MKELKKIIEKDNKPMKSDYLIIQKNFIGKY